MRYSEFSFVINDTYNLLLSINRIICVNPPNIYSKKILAKKVKFWNPIFRRFPTKVQITDQCVQNYWTISQRLYFDKSDTNRGEGLGEELEIFPYS